MKRASIKDIATALGTSTTTVSWVLSGKGDQKKISDDMQQKIRDTAQKMNYQRNNLACGLTLGYTKTLGFIVSNISNIFYAEMAHAVEREAEKYGYNIIVCSSEDNPKKENQLIRMLKSKCVDGIILSSTKKDKSEILTLKKEGYPLVLVDRYFSDISLNSVVVDNLGGSYELVQHMIACGNRKIGVISTANHLLIINNRLDGYKKAMREAGIRVNSQWIKCVRLENQNEEIEKAIDDFLKLPNRVEAIFCTTHFLAIQVYSILKKRGLKVPNSMGVACFDHFNYFEALDPSLTAVQQPINEVGKHAVQLLLRQIEDPSVCQQIVLPTKLIIGKSC